VLHRHTGAVVRVDLDNPPETVGLLGIEVCSEALVGGGPLIAEASPDNAIAFVDGDLFRAEAGPENRIGVLASMRRACRPKERFRRA